MKKKIKWLVYNTLCLALCFYAVTLGEGWQFNLFRFMVWLNLVGTILIASTEKGRDGFRENSSGMNEIVVIIIDTAMVLFLASGGWFFTAAMVIIQSGTERFILNETKTEEK